MPLPASEVEAAVAEEEVLEAAVAEAVVPLPDDLKSWIRWIRKR